MQKLVVVVGLVLGFKCPDVCLHFVYMLISIVIVCNQCVERYVNVHRLSPPPWQVASGNTWHSSVH